MLQCKLGNNAFSAQAYLSATDNNSASLDTLYLMINKGDYAKAKSLYEQSLGIRQRVLDPHHAHVANSLHNLAGLEWAEVSHAACVRFLVNPAWAGPRISFTVAMTHIQYLLALSHDKMQRAQIRLIRLVWERGS